MPTTVRLHGHPALGGLVAFIDHRPSRYRARIESYQDEQGQLHVSWAVRRGSEYLGTAHSMHDIARLVRRDLGLTEGPG